MELMMIEDINIMTIAEEKCYKKNKNFYDCLSHMKVPGFKELVIASLNEAGTKEKLHDAIEVTKWLIFLLENDKLLSESMNSYFIDLLIASSLLHNLTYEYNKSDWTLLFKTRDIIEKVNKESELNVAENYLKSIYLPIESQLGKSMPIDQLVPNPNSPGHHVALACAIYYKKMK